MSTPFESIPRPSPRPSNERLRAAMDVKCQQCIEIVTRPNWTNRAAITFGLLIPVLLWLGGSADDTYFVLAIVFALVLSGVIVFFNFELRRKTRSLAESEARYRELVVNLPAAVFRSTLDSNWNLAYVSDAIAVITGFPAADFMEGRRSLRDLVQTDDRLLLDGMLEKRGRRRFEIDLRINDSRGEQRWIQIRGSQRWTKNLTITVDGIIIDISEQKNVSELLLQHQTKMASAARLSSLGEMAGGIAHEINNPLAIINLRTHQLKQLVEKNTLAPGSVMELATAIENTTVRISKIIKSLHSVARESDHDPFENVPVKAIVDDVFELCLQRMQKHGIGVSVQNIPGDLEVDCRRVQISQVMINLLNNAFDAVVNLPQPRIEISGRELADGGREWVEIAITDSGKGIKPDLAHRIFQPFFTTKNVGQGIGLGLSISKGMVESHEGTIHVDTEAPSTRFVIRLPKFQARNYH